MINIGGINNPKQNKESKNTNIFTNQPASTDTGSIWSAQGKTTQLNSESSIFAGKQPTANEAQFNPTDPDKVGKSGYEAQFADYKPTNEAKYKKVMTHVDKKTSPEKAKAIANMVCSLSDKYGLDPEITVAILEKETGGYNFTKNVMAHSGSQYKGVMQVDKTTVECLYANPKDANNPKLSQHKRAIAYDAGKHFQYDQDRMAELKKKYPTADSLYKAIQTDVSLGVEVGIMAYKSKLSVAKGNTRRALASYCGNQYRLPADSTAVKQIYPIPQYKNT